MQELCDFFGLECLPTVQGCYLPDLDLHVRELSDELCDEIRHFWWQRLLDQLNHPRPISSDWAQRWADEVYEHPRPFFS
jgi:hypothetical protein